MRYADQYALAVGQMRARKQRRDTAGATDQPAPIVIYPERPRSSLAPFFLGVVTSLVGAMLWTTWQKGRTS